MSDDGFGALGDDVRALHLGIRVDDDLEGDVLELGQDCHERVEGCRRLPGEAVGTREGDRPLELQHRLCSDVVLGCTARAVDRVRILGTLLFGAGVDLVRDEVLVPIRAAHETRLQGAGLIGALVVDVGGAVFILVRATLQTLQTDVLRAAVVLVRDAIAITIGAAERLGRADFVRAAVALVLEAVLVVVEIRAAVIVFELVDVLGLEDAPVFRVDQAVLVVVELGAAVGVLEVVLVLGLVDARILFVDDAIAVRVLGAAEGDADTERPLPLEERVAEASDRLRSHVQEELVVCAEHERRLADGNAQTGTAREEQVDVRVGVVGGQDAFVVADAADEAADTEGEHGLERLVTQQEAAEVQPRSKAQVGEIRALGGAEVSRHFQLERCTAAEGVRKTQRTGRSDSEIIELVGDHHTTGQSDLDLADLVSEGQRGDQHREQSQFLHREFS